MGMANQLCVLASIWDRIGDRERRDVALDLAARLLDVGGLFQDFSL
jgi:hypothetical protein